MTTSEASRKAFISSVHAEPQNLQSAQAEARDSNHSVVHGEKHCLAVGKWSCGSPDVPRNCACACVGSCSVCMGMRVLGSQANSDQIHIHTTSPTELVHHLDTTWCYMPVALPGSLWFTHPGRCHLQAWVVCMPFVVHSFANLRLEVRPDMRIGNGLGSDW